MLAIEIRIFAAYPKRFLHIWRLAGTSNSHFRCASHAVLAHLALGGHIKFAYSLRTPSGSGISSPLLVHRIRIIAVYPERFFHMWRLAGRFLLANLALGGHTKLALSLCIPSLSCIYGAWRAHLIRIVAALVSFLTERKEGSARVPRDAPSQFVRQDCFPSGVELQFSI